MRLLLRLLKWFVILGFAGALAGVAALGIAYWILAPRLPAVSSLKDVQMQEPLMVYSSDGKLIASFGETNRIPVTFQQIPPMLRDAFLAAEDADFYHHPGVDFVGTARAAFEVLIHGGHKVQGGSTITQQVARNFFLSPEKSYTRKIMEWFLAFRIEDELSKNDILTLYLNKIFLGHRAYGVAAAAQYYYGKTLDQLTLPECAMLGGLPQAPSAANPITDLKRAMIRRNYVLRRMYDVGFITKVQYEKALATPDDAFPHEPPIQVEAPYVAEMARLLAVQKLGNKALTDGYTIYTTINGHLQDAANAAVRSEMLSYSRRHGWFGPESHIELPTTPDPALWSKALSALYPIAGLQPGLVTDSSASMAHVYLQNGQTVVLDLKAVAWARRYINENRTGPAPKAVDQVLRPGDIVRVAMDDQGHWQLAEIPKAQAALVSLRPDDGAIVALVGGLSYTLSQFNRVTQMARQPGSSFKPFLYSAAFQRGFTPASVVNDAPLIFADPSAKNGEWTPANDTDTFQGPTRLRVALAQSKNLVTIRLVDAIGINYARQYATRFGFALDQIPDNLSMALGTASVSPLQMARGYATFANGGFLIDPYFIQRIDNRDGHAVFVADPLRACRDCAQRLLADATPKPAQSPQSSPAVPATPAPMGSSGLPPMPGDMTVLVPAPVNGAPPPPRLAPRIIGPRNAYLIASIMQSVIRSGTGQFALSLHRTDLSGKTGSTNDYRDAWFGGFNSKLVTTAWAGFDNFSSLGHADGHPEFGAYVALPIWIRYMKVALAGTPPAPEPMPPGIVTVLINRDTGLPALPSNPLAMSEVMRIEDYERLKQQAPLDAKHDQAKSYDVF
ncbi:penicillin-binding protein 1A [Metallibacterium sp.]|nr:penicillin-binding protein 1A [Metallibacterium sp.]